MKMCMIHDAVYYGTSPSYVTNIVKSAGAGCTLSGLRSTSMTDWLHAATAAHKLSENVCSRTLDRLHGTHCRKICCRRWPSGVPKTSENTLCHCSS